MNVRDDEQPASGASFEPPSFDETGWTRERLLDALKSEIAHPWVGVVLATIRAREVEPDIVATLERARVEELEPASENLLFRGVHILAAARLTRGYGPFVALLAESQDRVGHLLGDAVTATLPKILVGMFGGDAEPLLSLLRMTKWISSSARPRFGPLRSSPLRVESTEPLPRRSSRALSSRARHAPATSLGWDG
jgi:hypothetical protein